MVPLPGAAVSWPAPCCLDHRSSAGQSDVRAPDTSHWVLSQDFFSCSGSFVVPCGEAVARPQLREEERTGPSRVAGGGSRDRRWGSRGGWNPRGRAPGRTGPYGAPEVCTEAPLIGCAVRVGIKSHKPRGNRQKAAGPREGVPPQGREPRRSQKGTTPAVRRNQPRNKTRR